MSYSLHVKSLENCTGATDGVWLVFLPLVERWNATSPFKLKLRVMFVGRCGNFDVLGLLLPDWILQNVFNVVEPLEIPFSLSEN